MSQLACKYAHFEVDLSSQGSTHTKLINLVGKNKRVLDVGCATGYLGKVLIDQFGCQVTGIECDAEAAKEAAKSYERVITADLDKDNWESELGAERFDVVLIADVLEHLRDPERVLRTLARHCTESIIVSIPNIAHASVICELLQGKFEYRDLGLLDSTHIHFFSKDSAFAMFERCGLEVADYLPTRVAPENTELKSDLSQLPSSVREFIENNRDTDVYQFVVRVVPAGVEQWLQYKERLDTRFAGMREQIETLQQRTRELEEELQHNKAERFAGVSRKELEQQLALERERVAWFTQKLQEHLVNAYRVRQIEAKLGAELGMGSNELLQEVERLSLYNLDHLPKLLRWPLKMFVAMFARGPLEPWRVLRRKFTKRAN